MAEGQEDYSSLDISETPIRSMAAWGALLAQSQHAKPHPGLCRSAEYGERVLGLLRTLLAISVLFDHLFDRTGETLVGGRLAVQLFYVISGFLISYVLTETDTYRDAIGKFYQNRFLRLYPLYITVALLTLLAHALLNTDFISRFTQISNGADAALLLTNALLFGQDWIMFLGIQGGELTLTGNFLDSEVPLYEELLVPQAWTLGVELDFYLVAPFILRTRRILWLVLLASLALRAGLIMSGLGRTDPWTYRFFPSELALFLLGALSQQILLPRMQRWCKQFPGLPTWGTAALIVVCLTHFHVALPPTLRDAATLLVFAALLPLSFLFQTEHRWDRKVGEMSYPIYICHALVILLFDHLAAGFTRLHPGWSVFLILLASVAFGMLLDRTIGRRVERMRRRIKAHDPTTILPPAPLLTPGRTGPQA
jgi:peptidoglycan/LPS O-acetylase OafA/YrhL